MNKQEYVSLFEKYVAGKEPLTPEEKQQLELYHDDFEWNDRPWDPALGDNQQIRQRILNRLKEEIDTPVKTGRIAWKWMTAAAIIIGVIGAGLFLFHQKPTQSLTIVKSKNPYKNDVLPGNNKAILTLSNGKRIVLNNTQNGIITKQGLATVNKTSNGQLVYVAPILANNPDNSITFNTVTTPRGGQYQVTLPDGTNVWLNAASSLRFPTAFVGNERNVELTGEGYFEVAKNKEKPFKVRVNNVVVEVLGTHFNIMAYDNEPAIKTTLLEGSVKIKKDAAHALLVPGQQALAFRDNDLLQIKKADLEETMAWKNGNFIFHEENIQDIMRKVARWYDVDVVYQGNVKNKDFGGSVSRSSNISELLQNLELTKTIHFKVDGRRVTVME